MATDPSCALASSNLNQICCNSFVESEISTTGIGKQIELSDMPDWGDVDSFCNRYGFYQDNQVEELLYMPKNREIIRKDKEEEGMVSCSIAVNVSNLVIPQLPDDPPGLPALDKKEMIEHSFFPDCITLIRKFQKEQFKDVEGTKLRIGHTDDSCRNQGYQKLSTEQILKLAGERFVQFSSQKFVNINVFIHPYGSSLSDLYVEDKQDVELAQLLLAAAEKVACHQFDRGIRLLRSCQWLASSEGTPVQRAVFYFTKALMERIVKETGSSKKKENHVDACLNRNILAFVAMHQELPFFQVLHFTAVQTILENVGTKSKVHVIDFHVSTGLCWPALMQAITQQKMDSGGYLKITAVETLDRHSSEQTGKLLNSFAKYVNLPFSYKVVFLSDIKDLNEEDLEVDPEEEAVVVYFSFILRNLISKPICLKNLMTVTRKMKPSVIVVGEAEANHNSPSFVNRFIEALFFYGALFDSLDESMARDDKNRMVLETGVFWEGIRNIVSTEGYERVTRSVSMNVWRAFFARFGMIELELSTASIYQASLIVKQFSCGKSCSLDVSSKCLIVGWKGTPLFSVSAWKFS